MPICSFERCFSGSRKKEFSKPSNVHLHKFPKDPEMRRKWLDQIKLGSNVSKVNFENGITMNNLFLKYVYITFNITNSGVVCSNHFSSDCFADKTFVQKAAGYSPINSRRLLPNAIPLRY